MPSAGCFLCVSAAYWGEWEMSEIVILEALVALVWGVILFADVAKRGKISSSVGVSLPSEILKWNIPGLHSVLADLYSLLLSMLVGGGGITHFGIRGFKRLVTCPCGRLLLARLHSTLNESGKGRGYLWISIIFVSVSEGRKAFRWGPNQYPMCLIVTPSRPLACLREQRVFLKFSPVIWRWCMNGFFVCSMVRRDANSVTCFHPFFSINFGIPP